MRDLFGEFSERDHAAENQNSCRHCKEAIVVWSPSMDGNHSWKHHDGGTVLCRVNGRMTGTHAELAVTEE